MHHEEKNPVRTYLRIAVTFAFAGCASKEEPAGGDNSGQTAALTGKDIYTQDVKIAFIPISTAGITNQIYNIAIAEAISMYPNVVINVFDGQYDVTVINNIIQECITQAYDAIIFESLDTEASNGAVTDAENAGIPVLSINGGAPSAFIPTTSRARTTRWASRAPSTSPSLRQQGQRHYPRRAGRFRLRRPHGHRRQGIL
jgi:ribose transport system substrate-binding protein/inositol transport system substrate-binding protein